MWNWAVPRKPGVKSEPVQSPDASDPPERATPILVGSGASPTARVSGLLVDRRGARSRTDCAV